MASPDATAGEGGGAVGRLAPVGAVFGFEAVGVRIGPFTLLDRVDAEVPDSALTAVVGPSGAGKSTLIRLCNRLEVATTGVVRYRGDDVADLDPRRLRRRVGMVFQRPTLFPGTVRDNLEVAAPHAGDGVYAIALERAELGAAFLDRTADSLSGGEAQRACLARTLVTEPDALVMDEPTSALDAAPRLALERLATQLVASGTPVVWVSHDVDQVRRIADAVIVLHHGRCMASGLLAAVLDDPRPEVRAALGGIS